MERLGKRENGRFNVLGAVLLSLAACTELPIDSRAMTIVVISEMGKWMLMWIAELEIGQLGCYGRVSG